MDCNALPNPANGQVSTNRTTFGETAAYSCNTGYNLVGDSNRTCQATGMWSGSEPTCQGMLLLNNISTCERMLLLNNISTSERRLLLNNTPTIIRTVDPI